MTRRGLFLFAGLGVAWGIPYVLIKVAVAHLSPAMLVLGRTGVAAGLLLPLAMVRGDIAPALRAWRPLLAYTVAELVIPWILLSSAEEKLPSATTALLIAAVPLAGVGVGYLSGGSPRLTRANWLGIVVGMAGVAELVGFGVGGSDLGAVAEVAVVAVGYAIGPAILARGLSHVPALGVVALSLTLTAAVYAAVVAVSGAWPRHAPPAGVIEAVVTLAVICSAGAFILMVALVAEIGPIRATAITYVNPAVALAVGALFAGESVTGSTGIGFALILAGSWLVTRPDSRRLAAAPEGAVVELASEHPGTG